MVFEVICILIAILKQTHQEYQFTQMNTQVWAAVQGVISFQDLVAIKFMSQ